MSAIATWLEGVTILDLSQYIPGPLASLMLADMGARVIKVEPPGGDPMADLGPRDRAGGPLFYRTLNAGKSVVRLDLKAAQGHARFLELVAEADVLIEGFRPGVMDRLDLSYARLAALNPGLIWCAISGYGASGPSALKAGHDANYLAEAGVLDRNGQGRPMFFDPPVADVSGSVFAALAIAGALNGRHRTGQGAMIDLALADVVMPLQMLQIADLGENGTVPTPGGTYLNGGAAYYNTYRTADDRHIAVGAVEPKFWATFSGAADRPDWIERQDEPIPQTALIADVAARIAELTLNDCLTRFAEGDCCVSPVLDIAAAIDQDRIPHRGLVRTATDGALQALFPAHVDGQPPATRPPLTPLDPSES